MRSPRAESQRKALIEAMLPDVVFDGWSRPALRAGARRIGSPAEEILRLAGEAHADLIVLGTHGRRGLSHFLLGSVAERVLRQAPCPVLTVRH